MKNIRWILFILLLTTTYFANARIGIAFVHGTGHQTNAASDYWGWNMINASKSNLANTNDYTVINCNFEKFMWTSGAAGCLAGQLRSFIINRNIDQMVIVTHSNGGNVVRWIMSNPTWDWRYPHIIDNTMGILAMAPSSKGTPLANAVINGTVFESALGWILGYKSDAVKQQQTSWMSDYNRDWLFGTAGRPALPVLMANIVGSDVETAFWDSDSYCGGYHLNLGLEVTQAWLASCSDGFLNCSSQEGAGLVSFRDKDYTNGREPLSHNQSRKKCFGTDRIIRSFAR